MTPTKSFRDQLGPCLYIPSFGSPVGMLLLPQAVCGGGEAQGGTPRVNRQGGQDLKKIITPKKYLRLTKNTHRLARPY